MAHNDLTQSTIPLSTLPPAGPRTASVVHDGSAFEVSAALRHLGFDVTEGPGLSFSARYEEPRQLAILATKAGAPRPERLKDWVRELCARGTTVLAVGASVAPVAELFGSRLSEGPAPASARLADVTTEHAGLFVGSPLAFRLSLSNAPTVPCGELNSEFATTARTRRGEMIGASHVFRPIHLLHRSVVESDELRPLVLANLMRMVRDRGGRAF